MHAYAYIYWSPQIVNYDYSMSRDPSLASQNTNRGISGNDWSCKGIIVYISRILVVVIVVFQIPD